MLEKVQIFEKAVLFLGGIVDPWLSFDYAVDRSFMQNYMMLYGMIVHKNVAHRWP